MTEINLPNDFVLTYRRATYSLSSFSWTASKNRSTHEALRRGPDAVHHVDPADEERFLNLLDGGMKLDRLPATIQ